MTDITRLLASLKRRAAHAKEFGDSITFVKLEDIDALVEALEKAQQLATQQGNIACALFDEVTAQRQRIAELEEAEQQLCAANVTLDARAELAERQLAELESRTVTVKLPPLNDDLISILGRPNFMCAHLAELLRKSGTDIKRKSEHEQAAIIHWFLGIYLEHGDKWEGIAKSDIQARAAGIKVEAE